MKKETKMRRRRRRRRKKSERMSERLRETKENGMYVFVYVCKMCVCIRVCTDVDACDRSAHTHSTST